MKTPLTHPDLLQYTSCSKVKGNTNAQEHAHENEDERVVVVLHVHGAMAVAAMAVPIIFPITGKCLKAFLVFTESRRREAEKKKIGNRIIIRG